MSTVASGGRRGRWEVADVVRVVGDDYRRTHRLSSTEQKALWAIEVCRTAALGGHLETCNQCGYERPFYNSCRNRHCPTCQSLPKARWLDARKAEILPVPYFHVVFTLPHELNAVALANKKRVYDILFQSVSKTLLTFGEDTLGGKIAATMILHTWDQQLRGHLHIHCAIPSFALRAPKGKPDGLKEGPVIVRARKNFLFPVKAMGVMFRGKFLHALRKSGLAEDSLIRSLYEKKWIVYSKPAFQGAGNVLDYIGRYTHRIAISNNRIVSVDNGHVTFSYRDRSDNNRKKQTTVSADEFLRRFLLHVLPASFMKIRHIGFLANKSKKKDLAICRALLGVEATKSEKKSTAELMRELTGLDLDQCPRCEQGRMVVVAEIPKQRFDSS